MFLLLIAQVFTDININSGIFTARSELRKVLCLAPSVCGFCLCMKYLGNRWTDLHQIHTEDVFGSSLGEFEVQGQRSKVKVTGDKNGIFRPFRRPACGLCLAKHL